MLIYLYPPPTFSHTNPHPPPRSFFFSPSNFTGYFNNWGGGTRRCDVEGKACKVVLTLAVFIRGAVICCLVTELLNSNHRAANKGLPPRLDAANSIYYINEKVRGKENLSCSVTHVPKQMTLFLKLMGPLSSTNGFSSVVSHLAKGGSK